MRKKVASNMLFSDLIPYSVFPNSFIRNGKITPHQKVLFEILCSYDFVTSNGNRKGWCSVSLETISEQMGIEKRCVQYHLKALIKLGMVTVIYRNSQHQSSIYILNILPGISEADRQRIAATRTTEVKNLISGLNTIKVQTSNGFRYVSEEEFDLQYLVTGERSSEIMEGEIDDSYFEENTESDSNNTTRDMELYYNNNNIDIVSNSPNTVCATNNSSVFSSANDNSFRNTNRKDNNADSQDKEINISFKKLSTPIEKVVNSSNVSNYNSKDPVERILSGNYRDLKPLDYCKYFKHKYELKYKLETLVIDRNKDATAIKNLLKEFEPNILIELIDFFIKKYDTLFANTDYPRPKIYQLNIKWILNKLLEQYYLQQEHKIENSPPTEKTDNVVKSIIL